jgi:uncharacterized protein (TIGR02145 family)
LYNWETLTQLAPPGWHIPSRKDFKELIKYLGGKSKAFSALITGGESGFDVLLSFRRTVGEDYEDANFWCITPAISDYEFYLSMSAVDNEVVISGTSKTNALSVRLIKD